MKIKDIIGWALLVGGIASALIGIYSILKTLGAL